MKPEIVRINGDKILTIPKEFDGQTRKIELLRVTEDGQILFNYKDWSVNTATDSFFRSFAKDLPQMCKEPWEKDLNQCHEKVEQMSETVTHLKGQRETLIEKQGLQAEIMGALLVGVVLGSIISVLVYDRVR